eukprot:COSAG02_NODE_1972_length_10217_cov_140.461653_1_plen_85_part_10
MQNQAPGYFHLNYLRSLYWKIVPFLHRLIHIQLMFSTRRTVLCVRIDLGCFCRGGGGGGGGGGAGGGGGWGGGGGAGPPAGLGGG